MQFNKIYMQKQSLKDPVLMQSAKKKKNKGWNELPAGYSESNTLLNSLNSQEVKGNVNLIALNEPSSPKIQENGMKKLSQMANLYHVEMSLEIGSGFASIVYLGECLTTQKPVCVKVIDLSILGGSKQRLALHREIRYLRQLDSPFVVKLLDSFESPSFCYLVMQFCAGGDLYRFMRKSPPLHPLFVRELIEQIAKGLFNLKQNHLIHRDFKTENILLGANFQAKIGDFGFCVSVDDDQLIHNVGSPIYMSPEVLQGGSHSYSSDIYGLGIIWYELLHGTAPWQALTEAELLLKKLEAPISSFRQDLGENDRAIISKCVDVCPEKRCTIQEILMYCQITNKPEKEKLLAEKESILKEEKESPQS